MSATSILGRHSRCLREIGQWLDDHGYVVTSMQRSKHWKIGLTRDGLTRFVVVAGSPRNRDYALQHVARQVRHLFGGQP